MQTIKFSSNWNNKLFQNCFTTFRPFIVDRFKPNEIVSIQMNFKTELENPFEARYILSIVEILRHAPESLCYLDTGYCKEEFIKLVRTMYKSKSYDLDYQQFAFCLFQRVKPLKINDIKITT